MVRGSNKTYGQLILDAQKLTGHQEVGETLEPLLRQLESIVEQCVQMQYEQANKKGFFLKKYYIHIFIIKDPLASQGMGAHNVLRIRRPHCRVTRPSPYQDEDHYLWSVENMDHVKFEWCIPQKETIQSILNHPNDFDANYVSMLRRYCQDKLESIDQYLVEGKIA